MQRSSWLRRKGVFRLLKLEFERNESPFIPSNSVVGHRKIIRKAAAKTESGKAICSSGGT
jgi:hypothetical protein